jgi:putative copper resistance protein D
VDWPLFAVRAMHLAATMVAAGTVLFVRLVAHPASREGAHRSARWLAQLSWIAIGALAAAIASGVAWFALVAAVIMDRPLAGLIADDALWAVATATRFGEVSMLRLGCAVLLLVIGATRMRPQSAWRGPAAVVLALGLAASVAWTGHSGAAPGERGVVQVSADALHLIAAAGWLGALPPLALLFAQQANSAGTTPLAAYRITRRFSVFGVGIVAVLIVSGAINSYALVGSVPALFASSYGRLVLVKIGLFLAMAALATANRFTHQIPTAQTSATVLSAAAWRRLRRNAIAEFSLGMIAIGAVAALGMMAPVAYGPGAMHLH